MVLSGERGIRTPETLLEFTRYPGVPLQPLEHLSSVINYVCFAPCAVLLLLLFYPL